jgi:hypothetical protein
MQTGTILWSAQLLLFPFPLLFPFSITNQPTRSSQAPGLFQAAFKFPLRLCSAIGVAFGIETEG